MTSGPASIRPDSILWRRFAGGTPGGSHLREELVLRLPALRRQGGARLAIVARAATAPGAPLGISIDGDPPSRLDLAPGRPVWLAMAPRDVDGAEVALRPSAPVALDGVLVAPRAETARAATAGLAAALLTLALLRARVVREAVGLGLFAAGLLALGSVPTWLLLAWPAPTTLVRLALPLAIMAVGLVAALRQGPRRFAARTALLIAAGALGCWVRASLLPSAGSWDVDYWRTAMLEGSRHGIARAYGGPDDVPPGHLAAQLRGRERVSAPRVLDRPIVVNYPPLAVVLWTASWELARRWAPRLDPLEAQALATKIPSLVGDLAAIAVLLWIHRARPWRAATLAALYWATPVSWLNSAAQGFQDGAYAPLLVVALAAAAAGHAFWAGATLGAAAMIKLPALLVAPAVAAALVARGRGATGLALAAAGGLAAIAAVFLPFALAGTLRAAIVHVNSIWLPGPASGGSPNLWWLAGHAMRMARTSTSLSDRVSWAPSRALGMPAYAIGRVLFLAAALAVFLVQKGRPGLRAAALGAATLVFSYAMLATGVYENHIHPLFLLLLAGGLATRRCRVVSAAAALVYVLDVLALSGLGRFYTLRYLVLAPLTPTFDVLRMGLGFDLTLVLAALNLALLAAWWLGLGAALRTPAESLTGPYPPARPLA